MTVLSRQSLATLGLAVSTFGGWYHNAVDFPGMSVYAPEMLATLVPPMALVVWWWRNPGRPVLVVTAGWGLLSLVVGGLLSVVPLPVWPFEPSQTVFHYQAHLVYTAAQIPLLLTLAWLSRQSADSVR